jgi:hypothetical protein
LIATDRSIFFKSLKPSFFLLLSQLNPDLTPFQRRYVSYVKRCDELERKLRFFAGECDRFNLELASAGDQESFIRSSTSKEKQLLESIVCWGLWISPRQNKTTGLKRE